MIHSRELTGKFYLKRRFFGGYDVMVEVIITTECKYDFSVSPEKIMFVKAKPEDIIKLNINMI